MPPPEVMTKVLKEGVVNIPEIPLMTITSPWVRRPILSLVLVSTRPQMARPKLKKPILRKYTLFVLYIGLGNTTEKRKIIIFPII
jgi:hypothetical protein